jgi:uncharacterized membrane protein YcjF (UPF0283 family)
MADGLIFDGPNEDLNVFECPHCKQTIDTSASVCRFCGARVDHEEAETATHLLAKVDQACSDASYLRNTAVTMFCLSVGVAIGLLRSSRFVLRVGFQNVVLGFCAMVLILSLPFPFWSLRWWRKNARLSSDDDEYQDARTMVRSTGFAAVAAWVTFGSLLCLVLILRANRW